MDTQRQNFWTESIVKEKKKRLDWLMKTDPNEFMRLSNAAAQEAPGKIENTIGKGQEKLLDDVGGIATLKGTSANVIGEKSSEAQLEEDRFPKNQVIAKYQTMPPKSNFIDDEDWSDEEGEYRRGKMSSDEVPPEMRPPSGATKKMLYDGFSKEGLGRKKYLETRKMKKPEERFDYTVTSNWEYGWQQTTDLHPPKHGRSRIVRDTFFRTGGALKGLL